MTDTAYIYPAPFWTLQETEWIKSLLLFFDDIATLLPDYMYGQHFAADPVLAAPLEERGLLHVLEPKSWLDNEATECFAEIIFEMLVNGVFDDLGDAGHFAELSQSRLGYGAEAELADFLVDELQKKGLARPSEDGVSIPLHPTVRTTMLVILGQLSRSVGQRRGMTIHPTTNYGPAVTDLVQALSMEAMPSRQHVVQLDLAPVAFDLSSIPLEDVLQFRVEHHDAYRAYARDLRRFMMEISAVNELADREALLLERQQELSEHANELQCMARRGFRRNLADWSLKIVGGVWSLTAGDPTGMALGAIGSVPGFLPTGDDRIGAYTYIFDIGRRFHGKRSR